MVTVYYKNKGSHGSAGEFADFCKSFLSQAGYDGVRISFQNHGPHAKQIKIEMQDDTALLRSILERALATYQKVKPSIAKDLEVEFLSSNGRNEEASEPAIVVTTAYAELQKQLEKAHKDVEEALKTASDEEAKRRRIQSEKETLEARLELKARAAPAITKETEATINTLRQRATDLEKQLAEQAAKITATDRALAQATEALEKTAEMPLDIQFFHYLPPNTITQSIIDAYAALKEIYSELNKDCGNGTVLRDYADGPLISEDEQQEYEEARTALEHIGNRFLTIDRKEELEEIITEYQLKQKTGTRYYAECRQALARLEKTKREPYENYELCLSIIKANNTTLFFPFTSGESALEKDILKAADEAFGQGKDVAGFRAYSITAQQTAKYKQAFEKISNGLPLKIRMREITEKETTI